MLTITIKSVNERKPIYFVGIVSTEGAGLGIDLSFRGTRRQGYFDYICSADKGSVICKGCAHNGNCVFGATYSGPLNVSKAAGKLETSIGPFEREKEAEISSAVKKLLGVAVESEWSLETLYIEILNLLGPYLEARDG